MKYSLKNRQFRKRNNIFGDRKKEQYNNEDIYQDLRQIEEASEEPEDSNIAITDPINKSKDKLYQFINFQDNAQNRRTPPCPRENRAFSNDHRPGRHGLSPINKPLLNNPNIRLTESQVKFRNSKNMEIDSQTVSFYFQPKGSSKEQQKYELKATLLKLCLILSSNSTRIDHLQKGIEIMFSRSQLILKQLNQGMRTAIKVQQQTDLLLNTMRSVYENLRICKLKQENLEMYFKQCFQRKPEMMSVSKKSEMMPKVIDRTVKYSAPKYSLASKHLEEESISEEAKESQELAHLIDYDSEASSFIGNSNKHEEIEHQRFFQDFQMKDSDFHLSTTQLSPFQANKMISADSQQISQSRTSSPSFVCSPSYSKPLQSQFSTFRFTHNQPQLYNEDDRLKAWLETTNQRRLKCWLDEMGCVRRPNSTYMFNEKGEVITLSPQGFKRLTEEGYLSQYKE